jgi:hypothetical protein
VSAVIDSHSVELSLDYDVDPGSFLGTRINLPTPDTITVSEDVDRNPFVMASLTMPRPSDLTMTRMDPRGFPIINIRLRSTASVTHHLPAKTSDITARFFPGPISALTVEYGGADSGSFSQDFPGTDVTTTLTPGLAPTTKYVRLLVTDVEEDIAGNTVTVNASGLEVLLDMWANISPLAADMSSYASSGGVLGIVAEVLRRVGLPSGIVWSGSPGTPTAEAMYWQPGQSARDFINGLLEWADLRLYGRDGDSYYVAPTGTAITSGFPFINLDYRDGITDASRHLSTDSTRNAYYDAVLITYKWQDSAGADQLAFDRYPNSGTYRKPYVLNRDRAFPGIGAAQAIFNRARKRGGDYEVTRVSRYDLNPAWESTLLLPGETVPRSTNIKGVTWTLPKAEMTIRLEQKEV